MENIRLHMNCGLSLFLYKVRSRRCVANLSNQNSKRTRTQRGIPGRSRSHSSGTFLSTPNLHTIQLTQKTRSSGYNDVFIWKWCELFGSVVGGGGVIHAPQGAAPETIFSIEIMHSIRDVRTNLVRWSGAISSHALKYRFKK